MLHFHPPHDEFFDIVYKARVFDDTYSKDITEPYNAAKVIEGGTGYDLTSKLPDEVEHCFPDYSLYGITDTAYGYLTRGCPRGCPFCIVKAKEGAMSYKVADLSEFWNGQKYIELLDPNITACPDFDDLLHQLIESKAYVNFNQGLDIRLMTMHKAELINQCKRKMMHFAWDNPKDTITPNKLAEFSSIWKGSQRNRRVYVLTNFGSTLEEDLYRVYAIRDMGYDPYVMIYDKPNAPRVTRRLQRYVNNKFIFWNKNCPNFDVYMAGYKNG